MSEAQGASSTPPPPPPPPPPAPPPPPLFRLDLGANGGLFAPLSKGEIVEWIQHEVDTWGWIKEVPVEAPIKSLVNRLVDARARAGQIGGTPERISQQLSELVTELGEVFQGRKSRVPHSSTALGKRIQAYRSEAGDIPAANFAAVMTTHIGAFQPSPQHTIPAWRGYVEALIEQYQMGPAKATRARVSAAAEAFEELRASIESFRDEKAQAYAELHRHYTDLVTSFKEQTERQQREFEEAQAKRSGGFAEDVKAYKEDLVQMRKTFREELALRAPAEYWEAKRVVHNRRAWQTGCLTFAGLAAAGWTLWAVVEPIVGQMHTGAPPTTKVAFAGLLALFTVWGLRLLVRLFLSSLHLATDAAERVVMVKTYLSLLEGDRLSSKEDRQLILQALFRNSSDGIVKDEAVPISFAEVLTRSPR